jgi:hypothetical protein
MENRRPTRPLPKPIIPTPIAAVPKSTAMIGTGRCLLHQWGVIDHGPANRSANARLQSGVLLAQFARNDRHPIFIPESICTDAYNLSQSAPMRIRREFG